jgi:hypothetical protein
VDFINNFLEKQHTLQAIIDQAHTKGRSENEIENLITLHRANDVSERLMKLLEDRYGSSCQYEHDPDSYGHEDFQAFRLKIRSDYNTLIDQMGITV